MSLSSLNLRKRRGYMELALSGISFYIFLARFCSYSGDLKLLAFVVTNSKQLVNNIEVTFGFPCVCLRFLFLCWLWIHKRKKKAIYKALKTLTINFMVTYVSSSAFIWKASSNQSNNLCVNSLTSCCGKKKSLLIFEPINKNTEYCNIKLTAIQMYNYWFLKRHHMKSFTSNARNVYNLTWT